MIQKPSDTDAAGVAVFGGREAERGSPAWRVAYETGKVLAELGYVVVNGGYTGTMEASACGAAEAGGTVVGVTCSIWRGTANPYVSREVRTSTLMERLDALMTLGKAGYVALPGTTGTLVELALAWELVCKEMIASRPVVCMGGFWSPLTTLMSGVGERYGGAVAMASGPRDLEQYFPQLPRH